MIEIIFHGRGGQGAVTAADVLATAAFLEGKYAQSFPSFSGERRGAPVMAFARIADERFVEQEPVHESGLRDRPRSEPSQDGSSVERG